MIDNIHELDTDPALIQSIAVRASKVAILRAIDDGSMAVVLEFTSGWLSDLADALAAAQRLADQLDLTLVITAYSMRLPSLWLRCVIFRDRD
jgi:hypothetical protein